VGLETSSDSRFDVSRDAQRFLMVQAVREESVAPHLVITCNWMNQFRQQN